MKLKTLVLILVSFWMTKSMARDLPHGYPNTARQKISLNVGWHFHLGDAESDYYKTETNDSKWEVVSVPHTLKLTSMALDYCEDDKNQNTFQRNVGWYRKTIKVTSDKDKKVFLEFEGAHQQTTLWVNGKKVGHFAVGGYSPFHFDISKHVKRGENNQITLLVDNRKSTILPPDPGMFDYIKFSGLYRDVYLVETDPLHITFNWEAKNAGIFITTPSVDPVNKNATVDIKTVLRNEYSEAQTAKVIQRIVDADGLVVLKLEDEATIEPGVDYQFDQIGAMEENVHLWDIDNPYLYRINTQVEINGKPVDMVENKLGLRKFYLDNERGFILNDKPIKLIGFNRHQHYGYIGDALPNALHYKDMLQFKELGFNVVRTAHYPHDNAIMDACDELGILVYEEAPTWISMSKEPQWWNNFEQAARIMVRNHRNHPSIVIWGAGINHRGYVPRANNAIKQEDPGRLTASQSSRWTGWQTSGLTDIFANMMYGPGIWDRSEPLLAMEGNRGPKTVASYKRDPKLTGIISWTAHAYYTFHPTNNKDNRARGGAMSIFRQPRKEILWYPSEMRSEPYLHIADEWKEGIKQLNIYSNADELELILNDTSLGKYKPSTDEAYQGLDHPPFEINIEQYAKGTLEVKAYVAGHLIAQSAVSSPEKAKYLKLSVDTVGRKWHADGSDILLAYAQIVDANGTKITDYDGDVKFSVKGDASIIGDKVDIMANPIKLENGEAPVLIQAGSSAGNVVLSVKAKGLKPASAKLNIEPFEANLTRSQAKPIYDFESISVDLGAPDQLVQWEWTEWSEEDNKSSEKQLNAFGGIQSSIASVSNNGILRWLGEMNVIGNNGFVYGEGVICIDKDGLALTFEGLPKGNYKLSSYHHAPRSNSDSMDPNKEKLKSQTIHKLPYASHIEVSLDGQSPQTIQVTEGKEMQYSPVSISHYLFSSDGKNPVKIIFKDTEAKKGVWLNGFTLSEWF